MRDRDLELIAALVEGRLEDETEARALIDSAPEYRGEYEAQKLAFEALSEVGSAEMSEAEKAALHRDVWTELRDRVSVAPAGTPWYARWVPAAAGVFVVVGIVAVLSQVGGDDAGEPMNVAADSPAAATTSTAGALAPTAEGGGEQLGGDGGATATTTAAEDGASDDAGVDQEDEPLYSVEAARVREGDLSSADLDAYEVAEESPSEVSSCLVQLGFSDYEIVATLTAGLGDTPTTTEAPGATGTTAVTESTETTAPAAEDHLLVAVPASSARATAPVAFIDLDGCQLVYLDE